MSYAEAEEGGDEQGGPGILTSLPAILWQRRWWVLVPLVIGSIAAVLAILLLPTTYRSTAVILVESPQLPGEVIGVMPDNRIDRRIAGIREQITSRPDLLALIDAQGLYPGERQRLALSKLIKKMRDAIDLSPTLSTNGGDPNRDKTILFSLSFDYERPAQAQAVAQALMERLLELNSSQNSTQANNSVQFLTDQASDLQTQIRQIEGEIAGISARNGRALAAGSMPMIASGGGGYEVQIAALQRDNSILMAQRRTLQGTGGADPRVSAAEAQLAQIKAIYADNHPDVIFAQQRLAEIKAQAKASAQPSALSEIDQQISFNNSQMAGLRAARSGETAQVSATINAQAKGPLAQQQITLLQQKLTGVNDQFQDVSRRLLTAKAGVRANDEQMGEHLSVIDPPIVPDTPYSPNRLLIAALGIIGGLGGGMVLALLIESIARPIRSPDALQAIDGHAPLAVIPNLDGLPFGTKRTRSNFRWLNPRSWFGRRRKREAIA